MLRWVRAPLRPDFSPMRNRGKNRLRVAPLGTLLGSVALWPWIKPNRPRGKRYSVPRLPLTAPRSSVDSSCPRTIGPAIGGDYQPAPKPDVVTKEALRVLHGEHQRQRRKEDSQSFYLSVGGGCTSAVQGDLGGYPGGNALGDSLVTFPSGRKSPQRSA